MPSKSNKELKVGKNEKTSSTNLTILSPRLEGETHKCNEQGQNKYLKLF